MRLSRLLDEVDVFDRPNDAAKIDVTSVTDDARLVKAGALFCCVKGTTTDGHDLASEAATRGAVALLVERPLPVDLPQVRVPDARAALAPIAASFWRHPSRHLRVAGITGTNGKTTTTHLLAAILRKQRWDTAVIGTLSGLFTTPPAMELQALLAKLRDEHRQAVVMEVSSHALVQHRVDAMRFTVGVFTNLTQDHLDYHKTMSRYFEAKSLLFDPGRTEKAVVNVDDSWGSQLVERVAIPAVPYSLADAHDLQVGPLGSTFVWEGKTITLPLIGRFNVYNALAAATAAKAMGVWPEVIAETLSSVENVPGRLERIDCGQPFTVLVDFAHTPDGLEKVLEVAREAAQLREGKVLAVFGCGGDRDPKKRPLMAAVVERLADIAILTNDNPRSEDPSVIANQALAGMQQPDAAIVELDRAAAIFRAIELAQPGDVVVIAGKGHETTQEVNGQKSPFDDRIVATQAINERAQRS